MSKKEKATAALRGNFESTLQAANFDLELIGKLWDALMRFGPQAAALVQQVIQFFAAPSPVPVMKSAHCDDEGCCDHHACCLAVLHSAIHTAQAAACHYAACCEECCEE